MFRYRGVLVRAPHLTNMQYLDEYMSRVWDPQADAWQCVYTGPEQTSQEYYEDDEWFVAHWDQGVYTLRPRNTIEYITPQTARQLSYT